MSGAANSYLIQVTSSQIVMQQNTEHHDDIYPALIKKQPSFSKRLFLSIYNYWLSFMCKVCHQDISNPNE
ncbi:MAG: hypothetical protein GY797_40645 [Deltaproteobacteria bacterium]|nr:hypothetical protein [Deltaproteobacteria bacterium]